MSSDSDVCVVVLRRRGRGIGVRRAPPLCPSANAESSVGVYRVQPWRVLVLALLALTRT